MQRRLRRSELELHGPRSGLQVLPPRLWRGMFCAVYRADVDFAHEAGQQRARWRRFSGGSGGAEPSREVRSLALARF
eukprot:12482251-Alexandrium_andersonii.AAC.1